MINEQKLKALLELIVEELTDAVEPEEGTKAYLNRCIIEAFGE